MDLDLSDGTNSAFGISQDQAFQYQEEKGNPLLIFINAALALGSEPLGMTFDAVIENVGHLNLTAESLGFVHFKELIVKMYLRNQVTSYDFFKVLRWANEKGILNEAAK